MGCSQASPHIITLAGHSVWSNGDSLSFGLGLALSPKLTGTSTAGCLNLGTVNIEAWTILCCGRLAYILLDVWSLLTSRR